MDTGQNTYHKLNASNAPQNRVFWAVLVSFSLLSLTVVWCAVDFYVLKNIPQQANTSKIDGAISILQKINKELRLKIALRTDSKKIDKMTLESVLPKEGRIVSADLGRMTVSLYENGKWQADFPIISKGRPGSQWETPAGLYRVLNKEGRHFSSLGEVYMPYSMQFFGNFFIHGWPYYKDGTEVAPSYSGGCIRMTTADAKKIYAFVELNTPIFIFDSAGLASEAGYAGTSGVGAGASANFGTYPGTYSGAEGAGSLSASVARAENISGISGDNVDDHGDSSSRKDLLKKVTAKAYLVADLDTGEVYTEKALNEVFPVASISKLLTALVANEVIHYNRTITINRDVVNTPGQTGGLVVGEKMDLVSLLHPLLMESSNDAARALALAVGEADFVGLMNAKARAIGLSHTSFADSAGFSPENKSTASDLFKLSRYLYDNNNYILSITKKPEAYIKTNLINHQYKNFNVYSDDPNFIGGKTGHTNAAKDTFLTMFKVQTNPQTNPQNDSSPEKNIAIIVLSSDNRKNDVDILREWFSGR